ncbi:DUF4011 domain-containing protein [Herbiconiux sp. VKM Ac-1786]|uniref:DUF4011 domain-containing protein n=1 Tax=Herbiconiux sp. VKM Ac-1786 TaxID=2783824 RepID=UPI00188CE3C3|nr:DUF4011 domain-containing protein [Herbiconiux sp. VKM Ac-1786]MBF4573187.1 DUF4011 domain-containing protein [Herbiconiux sp. VKM Ac-1786]
MDSNNPEVSRAPEGASERETTTAATATATATAPATATARLELTTAGVVSYALANARLSALEAVTITNDGPARRGAKLEIEATDAFGSLGAPSTTLIDLAEHATITLDERTLHLDPARMLAVDEQRPGRITARLSDADGTLIAQAAADVDVLAASQWRTTPVQLGMELLPAYVQPNAAAIQPLLHEAGELLEQATGDRSMTGYQLDDPSRVDATVAAIFEAMRQRGIRYAEPPASWAATGQKVRTPAEVLEGRVGTCLDTTVVLAAALEQAGINSTLWIFDGHALLGYWRHNSELGSVVDFEPADLINRVALGQIVLIETTAVTDQRAGDVEAAKSAARARIEGAPSTFIGAVDVGAARSASIFPLPSRSVDADGSVVVTEYRVAPRVATRDGRATTATGGEGAGRASAPPRVAQWKNSLLDLSLRNRLINFTDRAGYSLAVPSGSLAQLEDQISSGLQLSLRPSNTVSAVDRERKIQYGRELPDETRAQLLADRKEAYVDITDESYATKLRYLAYKAKTIVEETGANNLYLAFGMLHWTFNDRELRSPLILVPVTLTTANRGSLYRLTLDESGASTPNYCLLEKLGQAFDLSIPGLAEPVQDGAGIDLQAAFTETRQAVLDAGLPFRVDDTVNLGILQFAKFRLWKDLDENWESLAANPLVKHLIETPTAAFADPVPPAAEGTVDLDALSAQCPVPADSSQLEAVAEAAQGRTFVLEGPPGTGKSQTITNLLAKALTDGKRVLFVAEKRAALSVVQRRLEEIGLGPFSLDLHDKGARPTAVRAQIKSALEHRVTTDGAALTTNLEIANSNRRTLSRYADRLHESNPAGLSLYSARTSELAADAFVPALPVPASLVAGGSPEDFDAIRTALRDLPETADYVRPQRVNPWGFVVDRPEAPIDATAAHAAAKALDQAIAAARDAGNAPELTDLAQTPEQLADWSRIDGYQREPLAVIDAARDTTSPWNQHAQSILDQLGTLAQTSPSWLQQAQPEAIALDATAIHAEALAADQSGFFGRKKRRRAVAARLATVLKAPDAVDLKQFSALTGQIAASAEHANALRATVQQLPGMHLATDWNPLRPSDADAALNQIAWLRWVGSTIGVRPGDQPDAFTTESRRLYETTAPDANRSAALSAMSTAWGDLIAAAHTTANGLPDWADARQTSESTATPAHRGFFDAWAATRPGRAVDSPTPVALDRWLAFSRALEPLRSRGLTEAVQALETGDLSADDARLSFEKGLAAASVDEREQSTGLADFDPTAHNRSIERFTTSALAIRAELPNAIPAHVLALRRFDSSAPAGQVGLLRRQLERQRGGMSVRTLLDTFGELITQILPITLMSPESVARFFPAKPGLFDIVVFDEASQIRVADAVGAMGRADSVVVVGDSKQMPPTSFGETAIDADDELELSAEAVAVVDEESILSECVQSQVPSKWLSWHYRSQDESLITFSNHHYYESRLSSFPAPLRSTERDALDGYGVSMVRVNGVFNRAGKGKELRTNRIEAEAIVTEIRRRFDAATRAQADVPLAEFEAPSLGVVTFNAQQRDFIENLLRDTGDERILKALDHDSEGLFVKNLENVQGDERDAILFSIAFSVNDKGFLPLNFGPLQRAGGERRLNVAVTRARRQVLLFASFDPSELRAEQTSSVGVKHLKSYLEMASRGSDALEADPRRTVIFDRHRDDIASELRMRGLAVKTDVGLSDFRVDLSVAPAATPDRPLLAVLLDGDSWRARRTVADRDGLPTEVLKNLMHWPAVERVWLPEWLHAREAVLDRLELAVADALAAADDGAQLARVDSMVEQALEDDFDIDDAEPDLPAPPLPLPTTAAEPGLFLRSVGTAAPASTSDDRLSPYTPWVPRRVGSIAVLDALPRQDAARAVEAVIREIVTTEGSVHLVRLAKLVAAAFELNKVAQSRATAILRHVPAEMTTHSTEPFAWPTDIDPTTWRGARSSHQGDGRSLDHVSLIEIANAMSIVAEASAGLAEPDLKREAFAVFGGRRMTEAISARLDAALDWGVENGRLRRAEAGIIQSAS